MIMMRTTTKMEEKGIESVRIDCDYQFSYPPSEDSTIKEVKLTMIGYTESCDKVKLATAVLEVVPSAIYHAEDDDANADLDMFGVMDGDSSELGIIAAAMKLYDYDQIPDELWFNLATGEIVYLKRLIVEEEYRSLGIGSLLIENIPMVLDMIRIETGVIAVIATPIDEKLFADASNAKAYADEAEKLNKFYEKNRFICFSEDEHVMLKLF